MKPSRQTMQRVQVHLHKDQLEKLQRHAAELGTTTADLIRQAVRGHLLYLDHRTLIPQDPIK